MEIKEEEVLKSVFTGQIYKIIAPRDRIVALKSLDGSSRVLTVNRYLDLFYEKIENIEAPSEF